MRISDWSSDVCSSDLTFDFLAHNFCVCDRWFTPLPLGTQANRLMAMSGASRVVDNVTGLPDQHLVYDWLEERGVPWRVYVPGGSAPFFIMIQRLTPQIVKPPAFNSATRPAGQGGVRH